MLLILPEMNICQFRHSDLGRGHDIEQAKLG